MMKTKNNDKLNTLIKLHREQAWYNAVHQIATIFSLMQATHFELLRLASKESIKGSKEARYITQLGRILAVGKAKMSPLYIRLTAEKYTKK